MNPQPKSTAPPEARTSDDHARHMLAQLHKADAAVRCFPEPRSGPAFESAQRNWSAVYARALALGALIEAENA